MLISILFFTLIPNVNAVAEDTEQGIAEDEVLGYIDSQKDIQGYYATREEIAHGVTLSSLGLVKNSQSAGYNNIKKIKEAINAGTEIIVDGVYYLYGGAFSQGGITMDKSLEKVKMTGLDENASLIVSSNMFRLGDTSLYIRGINFKTLNNDSLTQLFDYNEGFNKIKEISIKNCSFTGRMKVLKMTSPSSTLLPDVSKVEDYLVERVTIENNEINDVLSSPDIFSIYDYPVKHLVVRGNKVRNSGFAVVACTFSHGSKQYIYRVSELRETVLIEKNYFKNDEDYDIIKHHESFTESNPSLYNSLIVLKGGNQVTYRENYIEGLHHDYNESTTTDENGTPLSPQVYDAYLSAKNVLSEHNTWKNNLKLNKDKTAGAINKSKNTMSRSFEDTSRVYRNNTYIVEKDFPERILGQDFINSLTEQEYISLTQINTDEFLSLIETVKFDGNYIDCISIDFKAAKNMYNQSFNHNTVKADYVSAERGSFLTISTVDTNPVTGEYDERLYEAVGNDITIAKTNQYLTATYKGLSVINGRSSNPYISVDVENNSFNISNYRYIYCDAALSSTSASNNIMLSFNNNKVIFKGEVPTPNQVFSSSTGVHKTVSFKNNDIKLEGPTATEHTLIALRAATKLPLGEYGFNLAYSPTAENPLYKIIRFYGGTVKDGSIFDNINFKVTLKSEGKTAVYTFKLKSEDVNANTIYKIVLDGTETRINSTSKFDLPHTGEENFFKLVVDKNCIAVAPVDSHSMEQNVEVTVDIF